MHCVESVQIRSFSPNTESLFYRIQSKYGEIRTRKNSVFGHFSHSDERSVIDNKIFRKAVKPALSDKVCARDRIHLIEKGEIV